MVAVASVEMGSQVEMQRVIRQREEKIKELERLLQDKDDLIQELNSKLDKYQSVVHVPTTTSSLASIGYRRQGIAAESQTPKSLQDLNKDVFKVHTKPQRYLGILSCSFVYGHILLTPA